jgi:hypothetical protein
MGRSIPGWVNRLAHIGYMCNCLLPEGLQVTVTETTEFPNGGESGCASGDGKEMVESESDQERALITVPNGNLQAFLRDSFKEVSVKLGENMFYFFLLCSRFDTFDTLFSF